MMMINNRNDSLYNIETLFAHNYPVLADNLDAYVLPRVIQNTSGVLYKVDNIQIDEVKIKYLEELDKFYTDLFQSQQLKIKGLLTTVRQIAKFDISKIQDLPDDIIGVIKSYIKPELDLVKEIYVLDNYARLHRQSAPRAMERWLHDVPKEIIVDLVNQYVFYTGNTVKSSDRKEEWCYYIHNTLQTLSEYTDKPVSNFLEYSRKQIDRNSMYGFLLRMKVFIAYRYELEAKKKANKEKLSNLKKTKLKKILYKR